MKQVHLLLCCLVAFGACAKENNVFNVKGKIGSYSTPAVIVLQYIENDYVMSQTAALTNGEFSFTGKIEEPLNARLVLLPEGGEINQRQRYEQTYLFILTSEKIEINSPDFLQNAVLSGSILNAEKRELDEAWTAVQQEMNQLVEEAQNALPEQLANEQYIDSLQTLYFHLQAQPKQLMVDFVKTHPQSHLSLMLLGEMETDPNNALLIKNLFNGLSADLQNSASGKSLNRRISLSGSMAIGSPAPDFTQNDVNGNPISLSDFKGKYVLIDFWASWCGPCRQENPNLRRAYERYKNKNFEILGISLDNRDAGAWKRAIEKDQLAWPQVSDLKGWKNEVAQMYRISQIPQNFLLNPEGIIVARNLRGSELETKLSEILN
ncbi:MAG: AhpC/TSA family protein [Candidatus Symbiothrix sp.]|nr:AhpC/TSA family protein [Candidatus Symbiothrix sp.]